jgi:integrase
MTKIKYLDSGELIRFFDQVKKGSVRDLILFSLAYRYGLRVSELVQIKLTDLSPSPYKPVEISIRRAKGGIGRNYPISFDDSKLLKKWLRQRSKIDPSGSNPFLFITPRSG